MRTSKSLLLSLSFYLVYVFTPITRLLPSSIKAGFIMFALFFFLIHLISGQKKLFLTTFVYTIGVIFVDFLIYYGVWRTNGAVDFTDKSMMLFVFWMPLLYTPALMKCSQETRNNIFMVFLTVFIVELVTTAVGNIIFPMASRQLASTQDVIQNRIYQALNIGGYGFIYSISFSLPLWLYSYKFINKYYFIVVLLGLIAVSLASYMTAITLSLAAILFSMSISNKRILFLGILLLILSLFLEGLFANVLKDLSDMAYASDNQVLGERLSSIRDVMMNEEATGDLGYRERLRNDSFDAFWASPLLGNLIGEFHPLGLHSEIIDWLGGIGLAGVFVIFIVIFKRVKPFLHFFAHTSIKSYILISLIMCLVFGYLNVITTAPELSTVLFVLPILLYGRTKLKAGPQKIRVRNGN